MIAPQSIAKRSGKESYSAFGFYLLEIISKCESIIGNLIEQHLQSKGILTPLSTPEQLIAETQIHLANAVGVPDWAKNMASSHLGKVDHEKIQLEQIKSFVAVLHENVLDS